MTNEVCSVESSTPVKLILTTRLTDEAEMVEVCSVYPVFLFRFE